LQKEVAREDEMNRTTNAARHEDEAGIGGRTGREARCLVAVLAIAVTAGAMPQRVLAQEVPPPPAQPQVIVVPPQQQQQVQQPQPVYVQQVQPGYVVAQPQPAYAPPPRRRGGGGIGLIVSGAVLLGVGWIANFIVGLGGGDDPFRSGAEPEWEAFRYSSFIPIAGPWVQLALKPTSFTQDYWAIWLIIDGLLQATGTALLISGGAVAASSGGELAEGDGDGIELMVLPNAGPSHAGLSLIGRF
jgi:hypothetical protein